MRSNFVLWRDGMQFYVTKRVGRKRESSNLEHFEAFFETEAEAYQAAVRRTQYMIDSLEHTKKELKEQARTARRK